MMSKVKITSGMNPKSTEIWLDDKPLKSAFSIDLRMAVDDVPRFTAEMYLKDTDIETDALCELYATINGKRYKLVEE